MEILRPLFRVNCGDLSPKSGPRFSIGVREGLEVATTKGLVFGGWAGVVVGRHMERRAALKQERRLAGFPSHLGLITSQRTRRKRHTGLRRVFDVFLSRQSEGYENVKKM